MLSMAATNNYSLINLLIMFQSIMNNSPKSKNIHLTVMYETEK